MLMLIDTVHISNRWVKNSEFPLEWKKKKKNHIFPQLLSFFIVQQLNPHFATHSSSLFDRFLIARTRITLLSLPASSSDKMEITANCRKLTCRKNKIRTIFNKTWENHPQPNAARTNAHDPRTNSNTTRHKSPGRNRTSQNWSRRSEITGTLPRAMAKTRSYGARAAMRSQLGPRSWVTVKRQCLVGGLGVEYITAAD